MKFREWKRLYKQQRQDAVPNVLNRLPFAKSAEKPALTLLPHWVRYTAIAAVIAITVCSICFLGLPDDLPTVAPSDATTATGSDSVSTPTAPTTPSTGDKAYTNVLTQRQTTAKQPLKTNGPKQDSPYNEPVLVLNTLLPKNMYAAIEGFSNAKAIRLNAVEVSEEHKSCAGVYYDTEKKTMFCATHKVKEVLKKQGISASKFGVHLYHPEFGTIVFTIHDNPKHSYIYDIRTDTLHKLSVSLYHCPSKIGACSTTQYEILHKAGGEHDDLFLIDLKNSKVTNILKNESGGYLCVPMDDERISKSGRYVFYTAAEGDANGVGRKTFIYEISTGKSRTFTGEICVEMPDGNLLVQNPQGYVHLDLQTLKTTPLEKAGLPQQYHRYVKTCDSYTTDTYRLKVCDRLTGQEKLLTESFLTAHTLSADSRYLYYYVRGENYVRVRDMATGKNDTIRLSTDIAKETEGADLKERILEFQLKVDTDGRLLLLYIVKGYGRENPLDVLAARQKVPYYTLQEMLWEDKVVNIASLEDLLRRFPENIVAFEGDGFLNLDYSPLFRDEKGGVPHNRQLLVEDYKNGKVYQISHQGSEYSSEFSGNQVGTVAASDQSPTRAMLAKYGIPIQKAERNYCGYFSSGSESVKQLHLTDVSAENLKGNIQGFFVREKNGYTGERMGLEASADREELLDFVRFTDTLSYCAVDDLSQYTIHNAIYDIEIYNARLNRNIFYVGCMDGQYYVVKKQYVAHMTTAEFNQWRSWLDVKEQACRLE